MTPIENASVPDKHAHRALLFALLALAGCEAVGPRYQQPQPSPPPAWLRLDASGAASTAAAAENLSRWWRGLNDALLSSLIEQALAASPDLREAQARLREARARRSLAAADFSPTLDASASAARSKASAQAGGGASVELYRAGFDAGWEPDVFGGRRRALQAAQADLEQRVATLADTQVSLSAEVALNYVQMRASQVRVSIARSNLASQAETLQLTTWRAQAGLVSALDVEQARTAFEQTRAQIPLLYSALAEAQHRIAILLGEAPPRLQPRLAAFGPIPRVPERVAVGIPAETLRRRPDVRAAERRLAAETERIGAAAAAGYPDFSLSGSVGLEALSLNALGAGGALSRSLLGAVSGVLFDGGRVRHRVEIQQAVRDQALAAYEATVATALGEVEDALAALVDSRARQSALADAAVAAQNAAAYALQRYASGLIDFQAVLDTQRTVLTVEDNLALAQASGATALIRLYKALGGGWYAATDGAPPGETDRS